MKILYQSLVFLLILTGILSSCTTSEATPTLELEVVSVQLNWKHGIQFLGFYVAQEKGFFADEGLELQIEPLLNPSKFTSVLQRVADGEFDFSLSTASQLSIFQSTGGSITAISTILQLSPHVFFAQTKSGIVTPADLEGHTIAIKDSGWEIILAQLLDSVDLTLDDVILVDAGFDMTPFYEGEIEVWAGFLNNEPILARQQGLDLVTFPVYQYIDEQAIISIFTSQELLETRPQFVEGFLHGTIQGWRWAVENPADAVDLLIEHFPDLADERDFHLASFAAYIPLIQPSGVAVGSIDCEYWLNDERFEALDSTESVCTTEIYEQIVAEEN